MIRSSLGVVICSGIPGAAGAVTTTTLRSNGWNKAHTNWGAVGGVVATCRRYISLKSSKLRDTAKALSDNKCEVVSSLKNASGQHTTREPVGPARTRFAPSPTGFVHLGSLRTALYNYLLAKSTGGQFLLRLEDTDQNRLVVGAEQNIYESLKWAGLQWDEGPDVGGEYGPYRQSERAHIYKEHADELMATGHAYRCFCSKERLDGLRDSARKLHPPSMASYDRKCANLTREQSDAKVAKGEKFTVRFKSPIEYPEFVDLLHGRLNLQTQVNYSDLRYEDPVLVKSDGLPTYHLANVVDDHLMQITHVVRGEEWLLSAPKHVALYTAFNWNPPSFVHIPLLTSSSAKKLSKRSGDTGISHLASNGVLPEALVNFVALLGWSSNAAAQQTSDVFTLHDLTQHFTLDGLTKGNAKVDDKKLAHFNQVFFRRRLDDPQQRQELIDQCFQQVEPYIADSNSDIADTMRSSREYTAKLLTIVQDRVSSPMEFKLLTEYLYKRPDWRGYKGDLAPLLQILQDATQLNTGNAMELANHLTQAHPKAAVFKALRFALAGGVSGIKVPEIAAVLGDSLVKSRLNESVNYLKSKVL